MGALRTQTQRAGAESPPHGSASWGLIGCWGGGAVLQMPAACPHRPRRPRPGPRPDAGLSRQRDPNGDHTWEEDRVVGLAGLGGDMFGLGRCPENTPRDHLSPLPRLSAGVDPTTHRWGSGPRGAAHTAVPLARDPLRTLQDERLAHWSLWYPEMPAARDEGDSRACLRSCGLQRPRAALWGLGASGQHSGTPVPSIREVFLFLAASMAPRQLRATLLSGAGLGWVRLCSPWVCPCLRRTEL